jgi:four helix bundle protein
VSQAPLQGQGPGAKGQGFRALLAWKKAHELALTVFQTTQPLARTQGWLVRQCCRSAVSVAANIAEGFSRDSLRDYIRYLNIARGSLAETEYYLVFLRDTRLLSDAVLNDLESDRAETGRLLAGLIRSLERKLQVEGQKRVRDGRATYEAADPGDRGPWPLALGPSDAL